jgi:hypothetical protein
MHAILIYPAPMQYAATDSAVCIVYKPWYIHPTASASTWHAPHVLLCECALFNFTYNISDPNLKNENNVSISPLNERRGELTYTS